MARRTKQAALGVRTSFEPARIAPQCLVQAYERALPVQRRPTRPSARADTCRGEVGAKGQRVRGGNEHG